MKYFTYLPSEFSKEFQDTSRDWKNGDVLMDGDGKIWIVETTNKIWSAKLFLCSREIKEGDTFFWLEDLFNPQVAIPMDWYIGSEEIPIGLIGPTGFKVIGTFINSDLEEGDEFDELESVIRDNNIVLNEDGNIV